ncbi:MAG TPA: type II toxin-antitoxin system HipA family toxin [Rhizomicrobium sp.]
MPRRRKSGRLNVFLNSRHVGQLNHESSGAIDFRYDPTWLTWEHTLPVSLSLPLRENRYIGAPVSAVFDNLLPDNASIRRKVAERVGADGVDAFSLLAALGRDCVGALQFLPDGHEPGPAGVIEGNPINDAEIADMLDNLPRSPLGIERDEDFRISIAGAQEKTALLRTRGRWEKPIGTTPTTHILKPQIGQLPNGIDLSNSVENEYLCLTLTKALDLPSANVEMATFGKKRVLIVERFDRLLTKDKRLLRVPQEDCCQALSVPWTAKYENEGGPGAQQILRLLAGSDEAAIDRRHFLKALIVFWLLGATDGHAKNFSVFLSSGGGYRMTPLYDIVSAQPSLDAGQIRRNQMKLAMAVGDRRHYAVATIDGRHFIQSAGKAGLGGKVALDVIDNLIETGPTALERVLTGLPNDFPGAVAASVERAFRSRLDHLERGRNE